MKQHEVPTHLSVEDKVVFGLSVRQFLYMLVGSSGSYTLWEQAAWMPDAARAGVVAASVCATLAFALLRPAGRPLEEWLVAGLVYATSARRSSWQSVEPDPANWRPHSGSWQELTPSLSWAEEDEAACD